MATTTGTSTPDRPPSAPAAGLEGQYEKLLSTVGNLQADLQRTVGVCQSLGAQNDKLKSHYEAVRTELIQLREKHNTTRKQLLEAVEGRVEADQRTETLANKWKVQLEARTRELESLQAKLVPQDLDMLRAKVQEELEVPHQRRVALLEAEAEKHRQMFCKARREHERCRAEYEQYTIDQAREMETLHHQHRAESQALKTRIQRLEESLADATRNEEGRILRRKLEEAEATKAQLHAEVSVVRSRKEEAEVERHRLVLAQQNEAAGAHAQICALEADKQALQRRCTDVEESANRSRRQAEDARDRLQDVLEEVSKLKEACAGKDNIALEARAEAKYASERLAAEWGREKAELKATNEVLTKRLALAERRFREVSEQLANRVRSAQNLEERARRETDKEVSTLREKCARLEAEMESVRLEGGKVTSAAQRELQRLRGEVERAQSEACRILREKEAMRERVAALQSATDRAVEAGEATARGRDEAKLEVAAAVQRAQQDRDKLAEAEGEIEGLRTRLQMTEEEIAALVADADQVRETHVRALKDIKRAARRDRESHVARVRSELESLRRRASRSVRKERKRSRAYKQQAIEAHRRGLRARQVLQARVAAMAVTTASTPPVGRGAVGGIARGNFDVDPASTFGAIFDGVKLGQAPRRVHSSRRGRESEGGTQGLYARRTRWRSRSAEVARIDGGVGGTSSLVR
ncbi:unnamed protein product, partial [Ascophyllum nodosum]